MTVPFGTVSDPLSLGSLYECTRSNAGGSEVSLVDIKDSTGKHLQGDARDYRLPLEAEYYLHSGATLVLAGSTVNGYFVDAVTPGVSNEGHDTMSVRAHKRVASSITDTVIA